MFGARPPVPVKADSTLYCNRVASMLRGAGIQVSAPRGAKEPLEEWGRNSKPSVAPCGPWGPHRYLREPVADRMAKVCTGQ